MTAALISTPPVIMGLIGCPLEVIMASTYCRVAFLRLHRTYILTVFRIQKVYRVTPPRDREKSAGGTSDSEGEL
jgi:hypothetical protein